MSVSDILFGGGILLWSLRRSFSKSILNCLRSSASIFDMEALLLSDLNHHMIMIIKWVCDTFLKCFNTLWLEETLLRILGSVISFSSKSAEEGSPNWERCCTMLSTLNCSQNCFTMSRVDNQFRHLSMDLDRRLDISALDGAFGFWLCPFFCENISFKFCTDISALCHVFEELQLN